MAEGGDTPDWGDEVDEPRARRYWRSCGPDNVAERAEVSKRQVMVEAAQRMAADAWMAVEDVRRARVRLAEIEREKVTWWRPEPICAVSCLSTLLKAPVGI